MLFTVTPRVVLLFGCIGCGALFGCHADKDKRFPRDSAEAAVLRARGGAPPISVSPALARALSRPGLEVEYRWVAGGAKAKGDTAPAHVNPWGKDTLYAQGPSFLDLRGVRSAEVRRQGDGALVFLVLTDSAADRLLVETDAHMGQTLGVFLNGELVTTATVQTPLATQIPLITDIPYAEAMDIGRRIMGARNAHVSKP